MRFVKQNTNGAWLLFYDRFTQLPTATGLKPIGSHSTRPRTSILRNRLIVNFLQTQKTFGIF